MTLYGITFFLSLVLSIWFWFKWDSVLSEDFIFIYGGITAIALAVLLVRRQDLKRLGYIRTMLCLLLIGCTGMLIAYGVFRLLGFMFLKGLGL